MERGTRVGDYEILNELGRGGMGRVYRVRNLISDRVEAMKVLLPGILANEELSARFLREIKVLASLTHPNIAALRTALTHEGQVAMVMELVEGQSLSKRLMRGPLAPAEALAVAQQVLAALSYAHSLGVVHRDVKPANMMVTDAGVVKLTDFGIARSQSDHALTATGTTAGSLSYMSPEQVNGGAIDHRSDLYSAGISLYEMVTGRTPFKGQSEYGLMAAHVSERPTPPIELRPELPPALNGVILRAIEKDPNDRFQSSDEFRNALAAVTAESPAAQAPAPAQASVSTVIRPLRGSAPVPQAPTTPGREGSASRLVYLMLGVILIVAAVAGAGVYFKRSPSASAPAVAGGSARPAADSDDPSGPGVARDSGAPAGESVIDFAAATAPAAPPPAATEARELRAAAGTRKSGEPAAPPDPQPPHGDAPAPETIQRTPDAQPAPASPPASAATPAPAPDVLEVIEREHDRAVIRAASVNGTLDRLAQQQARQGVGLRGDIAARQRSMNLNLTRVEEAIAAGDAAQAQRHADAARGDLEALERFLGR